ncbi:MAG: hypothetical protein ABI651_03855 [Verrucomicrobiota bacterium]
MPSIISRCCVVLLFGGFLSHSTVAENQFQLTTRSQILQEGGTLTSYVVLSRQNGFRFLPPHGWKLVVDETENKIILAPPDLSARISFTVFWQKEARALPVESEVLRSKVLGRFPEATISEEPCYANDQKGIAFDLKYSPANDVNLSTRLAFIPFRGGIVEFNLTSKTTDFVKHHLTFGQLLNSFQVEPPASSK